MDSCLQGLSRRRAGRGYKFPEFCCQNELQLILGKIRKDQTTVQLWQAPAFPGDEVMVTVVDLMGALIRIRAKTGPRVLSSMPDLLIVLAKSGIQGPKDLRALNLDGRSMQIGSGSQFNVFKSHPSAGSLAGNGFPDLEGLVVKKVKVKSFREDGKDLVEGDNHRHHLMSLELEILALYHSGIRKNRNIACLSLGIKHQIALDIAPGLEVLHKYHIVHGDMKPENILVFECHDTKVPFVAKLSDFGLCIDLFNSKSDLGTRAEAVVKLIIDRPELPSTLKSKLCYAIRSLIDNIPFKRLSPTPDLLRTDELTSYREWVISNAVPSNVAIPGVTDPEFNQGPSFWARLDITLLQEMATNASSPKGGNLPLVYTETLFVDFVERAASLGYEPAQAICHQRAHSKPLPSRESLVRWQSNSLKSGCMFIIGPAPLSLEDVKAAKDLFRNAGGDGSNGFMSIPKILGIAREPSQVAKMILVQGPAVAVNLEGNSIAHIVAALGISQSLKMILSRFPEQILARNDNGETLLYKACQAGQISILRVLREFGAELSTIATLKENLTPLHWLFMYKDTDLARRASISPFELPYGTPFHWACASRNFAAVDIPLTHGADINAKCFNNQPHSTPLALVVHFGDVEVVSFLLRHGANPGVKEPKDRTLLHRSS
ncbi:uncharacterized protein PAC_06102 [Phialocephala subalpina]|uniref:Protein kinase domain-containing protein n=1 Tax=Phialocephala subalpina TaxID=576137 RepID=A0A1L7WTV3_9HELO|nr:uncharacterized protein PAC_06102 [Phialocephala subalpina]